MKRSNKKGKQSNNLDRALDCIPKKYRKIAVLGYYDRHNLGDTMFEYLFEKLIETFYPEATLQVLNTDDVESLDSDIDIIICGGGDILNDYFLTKIWSLVDGLGNDGKHVPVYAIGVGVPYPNMIEEGKFDRFDFILHRNGSDHKRLVDRLGEHRVKAFPDLGFLLPQWSSQSITEEPYASLLDSSSNIQKNIGVFLSRTIYHPSNPEAYSKIVDQLAYFLSKLATKKSTSFPTCWKKKSTYHIFLIPSCTNESNRENDRIINQDVYSRMCSEYGCAGLDNIHIIDATIPTSQIMPIFKKFYLTVCTRFHPHVFSLMATVPFISVYTSHKVSNLLIQSGLESWGTKMEVDSQYLFPTGLSAFPLFASYENIKKNYVSSVVTLHCLQKRYRTECVGLRTYFKNLIFTPVKKLSPGITVFEERVDLIVYKISEILVKKFANNDQSVFNQLIQGTLRLGDFIKIDNRNFVAELISFLTTGNRYSKFLYGLQEQVLLQSYNLRESVSWIRADMENAKSFSKLLDNPIKIKYRCFNFEYFSQHLLCGYHRSGWEYVMTNLKNLHNPSGIVFDGFLDKTFGWSRNFLKEMGYLPYKRKWVGIFHHTPDQSFSTNNLYSALSSTEFKESLKCCQGIFVLSNYLKEWLVEELKKMGFSSIIVDNLVHPTELVPDSMKFSWKSFMENHEKKVVQIGAWMRDSYGIYRLGKPKSMTKAALKGKEMDNYFANEEHLQMVEDAILNIGCGSVVDESSCPVSRHGTASFHGPMNYNLNKKCHCNKYLVGMTQMIDENHASVQVISDLDNSSYDSLLTQNIVFINLIDASAVNTIIECIVRWTPILVNRLPAVEEYLGSDYPLYYSSYEEALEILNDPCKLKEGHEYLKQLDISRFHMKHFIEEILHSRIFCKIVSSQE